MILALTGHRPDKLGGYTIEVNRRLEAIARHALQTLKPAKVISGMAIGWDQAGAAAAVSLGIPLIAAVPFRGQESRWPYEGQRHYHDLLQQAELVTLVCSPGYAGWKMQRRNEWMVDTADEILALWNGTSGGTANCVRYAQDRGRKIHNVWSKFPHS